VRILTVTSLFPRATAPSLGVFILQRTRALAARGAEVSVVSPLPYVPPGPVPPAYAAIRKTPAEDEIGGLRVRYPRYLMVPKLGMRLQARGYAAGLKRTLRDEIARARPDLIDVHYLYPDACGAARIARRLGVPYACTARGSDVNVLAEFASVRRQVREALAGAAAVVAVSHDLARRMEGRLCDGPVEVIPNGIDRGRFFPRARAEARRALRLDAEGRYVTCVGHLVPVRGQELLLEALAHPGAPEGVTALFVGDGPDRARLESLAQALGVRAVFVGPVPHEDVPLWLCAADFSAQLNQSAGSPNAVLESIACGVPVLATDIPAMREAVPSASEGELVAATPEAAARGLARLFATRPRPSHEVSGWDDVADRVLDCFARALGAAPVRTGGGA